MLNIYISILWLLRFLFIAGLFSLVIISGYLLKNRAKYKELLEHRILNLIFVILYNLFCYVPVGLPSDYLIIPRQVIFEGILVEIGLQIIGCILFIVACYLIIKSLIRRKSIGAEEPEEGLITSGLYKYFRHPIYTGIILISIFFVLSARNFDGLLVFPLIFLANFLQAKFEEIYDIGLKFPDKYKEYQTKTRMFGPIWMWAVILICIIVIYTLNICLY